MKDEEDQFYEVALSLVKEAGQIVRAAFNAPNRSVVSSKSCDIDLVTESDQKVEKLLFDGLKEKFPDHKFIGEESTSAGAKIILTDTPTWIIDPIDGTTNFVHKLPFIGVCVGLYVKKEARIGIVYNPILDDLFTARRGKGAFKNGFPINVSETTELNKALVMITRGLHYKKELAIWMDTSTFNYKALADAGMRGDRSLGSSAINMCYVACGSSDAYIEFGLCCWDMAAAGLIIQEAGGVLFDTDGGKFELMSRRVLCASTAQLAQSIAKLCKKQDKFPYQDA